MVLANTVHCKNYPAIDHTLFFCVKIILMGILSQLLIFSTRFYFPLASKPVA